MKQLCLNRHDISLIGDSLGAGPTALLLHAGGENRAIWYPIMRDLEEAGLGSVAFDQRGHGQSGGSRDDSVIAFGDDAAAMIGQAVCPVVVGASLGGFAAMLALTKPDVQAKAAGLILVDVIPDPDPSRVRAFLDPRGMAGMPLVGDILSRADQFRAAAASLVLPVLLVRAGRSSAMDDDDIARLARLIPQLEAVSVADSDHLIAREAPGALAMLVRKFIGSDSVRERRIGHFVQKRGGDSIAHPGGTLAAHLSRVAEQLRHWAADAVVVDAARLHAAYGTAGFGPAIASTSDRALVMRIVGAASEALIHLYGLCDRKASYASWATDTPVVVDRHSGAIYPISGATRRALIALTVANELDVMAHDVRLADEFGRALLAQFGQWHPWLKPAVIRAIDTTAAELGYGEKSRRSPLH